MDRTLRAHGVPVYGAPLFEIQPADNRYHSVDERIQVKSLQDGTELLWPNRPRGRWQYDQQHRESGVKWLRDRAVRGRAHLAAAASDRDPYVA